MSAVAGLDPASSPSTSSARRRPARSWAPARDDLVDGAFALALLAMGAAGFRTIFDGTTGVAIALVSGLAATVVAGLSSIRRWDPLVTLGALLAGFVLACGPAVPDAAVAGILPSPAAVAALFGGLVHGWADLLTIAPPVLPHSGLGVVPHTVAYWAAAASMLLARRSRSAFAPVVPLIGLIGVTIAFGTVDPAALAVQGSLFAVAALAWGGVRANRDRRTVDGAVYWPRVVASLVMLAVTAGLAQLAAPHLPGVDVAERHVIRDEVLPPFDPNDYPSPLAGLRKYRAEKVAADTVLRVTGLPRNTPLRLATMDGYDGVVWKVSGNDLRSSGRFERVGTKILPAPPGRKVSIEVTTESYGGVWVPTVGYTRAARFQGTDRCDLDANFRYNRTTGTGATTCELREGDTYSLDVTLPELPTRDALRDLPPGSSDLGPLEPSSGRELLDELGKTGAGLAGEGSAYEQVRTLAEKLHDDGNYSDGGINDASAVQVPAGHSLVRLMGKNGTFRGNVWIGNAEQYAAAAGIMARQLGLPTRVVMGFWPGINGPEAAQEAKRDPSRELEVKSSDINAWIEVQFGDGVWVPFQPTPPDSQTTTQQPQPNPKPKDITQQEPPPTTILERPDPTPDHTQTEERQRQAEEAAKRAQRKVEAAGWSLPGPLVALGTYVGLPLMVLASVAGAIVGLKWLRRRRRRQRAAPVDRISGAWREAVDLLRDLGQPVVPLSTRRELASGAAGAIWPTGPEFASTVDRAMFGPEDPDAAAADAVWSGLDAELESLRAPLTRRKRLQAALSLSSLRPVR